MISIYNWIFLGLVVQIVYFMYLNFISKRESLSKFGIVQFVVLGFRFRIDGFF